MQSEGGGEQIFLQLEKEAQFTGVINAWQGREDRRTECAQPGTGL